MDSVGGSKTEDEKVCKLGQHILWKRESKEVLNV